MTQTRRTFDPVVLAREMARWKPRWPNDDNPILPGEYVAGLIAAYEAAFGMSGSEFMAAWRSGGIEDTFEANEFAILIRNDEQPEASREA